MNDLQKALADIGSIRQQVVAGTMFRGFGPTVLAATGGLAIITGAMQSIWPETMARDPLVFLGCWIATAVLSAALIGVEMLTRSRRHHSSLADTMILNAVEHFLPAGAAGAGIALVLVHYAPDTIWMLPGLWQVLVGVGILASVRFLPRSVALPGGWYFLAGLSVLMLSSGTRSLSPWAMAIPFAIGQIMLAAVLYRAFGDDHDQR